MKMLKASFVGLMSLAAVGIANASTVSLEPAHSDAPLGGVAALDLVIDFSDLDAATTLQGGNVSVMYDPTILDFDYFEYNNAGTDGYFNNELFTRSPTLPTEPTDGTLTGLVFGDIVAGVPTGTIGTVGTFYFNTLALAPEGTFVDIAEGGAGFLTLTFASLDPVMTGAMVHVVPEMEVWAMMLAGMGLLGWKVRRSQRGRQEDNLVAA